MTMTPRTALVPLLAAALVGATVPSGAPATAATAPPAVVLSRGDVALAVGYDAAAGGLTTRVRDATREHAAGTVVRSASETVIWVDSTAAALDTAGLPPEYAFLGPGPVHVLPETGDSRLPRIGWTTAGLAAALPPELAPGAGPDAVRLTVAVAGPGAVHSWRTGVLGSPTDRFVDTTDPAPDVITSATDREATSTWSFGAPGDYVLTITAQLTTAAGATLAAQPVVVRVHVGATPPDPGPGDDPDPDPDPDPGPDPGPDPDPGPGEPPARWDVPHGWVNAAGATVLNSGHVDLASVLDGPRLATLVKDSSAGGVPVWRAPGRTVLQVLPTARALVPDNPAYAFLGTPGTPLWQLAQTQQDGLLWPGWSTEHLPAGALDGGVTWALTGLSGPGDLVLYELARTGFGAPVVRFSSRDGVTAADSFVIPQATHAHGAWAFTAEGTYCLAMQRSARLASGQAVTDDVHLAVAVGTADVTRLDPRACAGAAPDPGTAPDTPPVAPPALPPANPGDGTPPTEPQPPTPGGSPAPGAPGVCRAVTVLSRGHVDYATRVVDGRLRSSVGDDSSGTRIYRDPSSVLLWLRPESRVTLPAGYGDIGPAGSTVWQVPQTQDPALVWLGWNTELLTSAAVATPVAWTLSRVDGPGTLTVYLAGAFGGVQDVVFRNGGTYRIPLGVHAHAGWAFSAEGTYRLTFTQSATLADGSTSSDTQTLTVAVGDVDVAAAARAVGCAGTAATGAAPASRPAGAAATGARSGPTPQLLAPAAAPDGVTGAAAGAGAQADPAHGTRPGLLPWTGAPAADLVPRLLATLGGLLVLGSGSLWGLRAWRRRWDAAAAALGLS